MEYPFFVPILAKIQKQRKALNFLFKRLKDLDTVHRLLPSTLTCIICKWVFFAMYKQPKRFTPRAHQVQQQVFREISLGPL